MPLPESALAYCGEGLPVLQAKRAGHWRCLGLRDLEPGARENTERTSLGQLFSRLVTGIGHAVEPTQVELSQLTMLY